jgi:exodeoxyribonuclease VII small subunit
MFLPERQPMENPNREPLETSALLGGLQPDKLSYESAFAELEQITQALEANQYSLEQALLLFERGQALARRCAVLLDEAELKVQQISGDELIDFKD